MNKDIIIPTVIFLLIASTAFFAYSFYQSNQKLVIYQELSKIDGQVMEAEQLAQDVEDYYTLSSNYYDYNDFQMAITYCEKSRDASNGFQQKLREIIVEIDRTEPVFVTYKNMLKTEIEIYSNLYEACEYFESANRAYLNDDYDNGGVNIDGMNEKIVAHDDAVERYNTLLAELNHEVEELR